MVQKIHPWGVILVTNLSLMWADQVKKLTAVPFIYIKKPMYNVNKIIFCNLFCIKDCSEKKLTNDFLCLKSGPEV